ncbi:hypothetical protein HU200_043005 [Digitaria exilis]|uniref:Uncharacterized protein n=1 Tax=Digitaria exilis TaxID=1010633 RepID=A0A835EFE3_9POAL|nr:hypothetical protein HU200_043005 [Digitaria exilis]CAB3471144.1 unnamed protein product [Digitaria exilis]
MDDTSRQQRPAAGRRGKGKAPAPPPPPPWPEDDEANGGHRRAQRRRRPPPRRVRARALGVMMAAGAYILLAEALSGERPSAAWMFTAFVLWIVGKALLLLSFIN